jgi:2-dehydropantoate 2-reductase
VDFLAGEIVLLGRLYGVPTPACELIQQVTTELARRGGPARSRDAADLLARLPSVV